MTRNLQIRSPKIANYDTTTAKANSENINGHGSIIRVELVDLEFYTQLASWQYSSGLSHREQAGKEHMRRYQSGIL